MVKLFGKGQDRKTADSLATVLSIIALRARSGDEFLNYCINRTIKRQVPSDGAAELTYVRIGEKRNSMEHRVLLALCFLLARTAPI